MGVITIEVPQKVTKSYRLVSEESARGVIENLDMLVGKRNGKKNKDGIDLSDIVGIWANREESAEEIALKLRSGWNRNSSDE